MPSTVTISANAFDARTVGDWWLYNSTTRGNPRMLTPDFHTWDEPLELELYSQRKFPAYGMAWMDGKGWGRYLNAQSKNTSRRSMIGFDSSGWAADTPAITLTGCRAIEISGVNLFRSTPGVLTYDTNAVGQNSAGIVFRNVGFGTRYDGDAGYDDPYDGLGLITQNPTNRLGYFGHATEGTNGTDSAEFYDTEFFYLQAPLVSWSPQTTRIKFDGSFFRWCDESYHGDESPNEIGEASGSGNILCHNCSWYDNGPFVYKTVKSALSNLAIIGGWYDTSDGVARTFLDCSEHTGVCNFTWSGVKAKPFTSGTAPFVSRKAANPRDTKLHSVDVAALPGGAPFYGTFTPKASMLGSYLLEKSGDPAVSDDDVSVTGLRTLYRNTTTGQAGVAIHNGTTLSLCRGEDLPETITEDGALQVNGPSTIDASSGAVAATLADGNYIGQRKTVYCSNADNAVTVTIASHEDGDDTEVEMDAGESLTLEWSGVWVDLRAAAATGGTVTVASVSALASLTGLSDGASVQTQGCRSAGDGGEQLLRYSSTGRSGVTTTTYGWYINGPGADDYFEAVNKSFAIAEQWGAVGDGVTDDKAALQAAALAAPLHLSPGKTYKIATAIVVSGKEGDVVIEGHGATLLSTGSGGAITAHAVTRTTAALDANAARGDVDITVDAIGDFAVGDVVTVESDNNAETSWNTTASDTAVIRAIDGTDITLASPLNFPYDVATETVQVRGWVRSKLVINDLTLSYSNTQNQITSHGRSPYIKNFHAVNTDAAADLDGGEGDVLRLSHFVTGRLENVSGKGTNYLSQINRARDARLTNISGENVRHLCSPGEWTDGVVVKGATGVNCTSTMDSHPAFNVEWHDVDALDNQHPNCRAFGFRLQNVRVRQNGTYNQSYTYLGYPGDATLNLADYPFLVTDYGADLVNVDWQKESSNRGELNGFAFLSGQRSIRITNCRTHAVYIEQDVLDGTFINGGEIDCFRNRGDNSPTFINGVRMDLANCAGNFALEGKDMMVSDCLIIGDNSASALIRSIGAALQLRMTNCKVVDVADVHREPSVSGGAWTMRFSDCDLDIADFGSASITKTRLADCVGTYGSLTLDSINSVSSAEAFADGDATPTVFSRSRVYETANSSPTTITDFDNATEGQTIVVFISDNNTTIDFTSSGLIGNGGSDWSPASGDMLIGVHDGTDWRCQVVDCTS